MDCDTTVIGKLIALKSLISHSLAAVPPHFLSPEHLIRGVHSDVLISVLLVNI